MTPEERLGMREWHVKSPRGTYAICVCGQLWTCPTIMLLDDLDAAELKVNSLSSGLKAMDHFLAEADLATAQARKDAERWRAQAGKLAADLDGMSRTFSPYPSDNTERWREEHEIWETAAATLADPDAASALKELRALREIAAALIADRALAVAEVATVEMCAAAERRILNALADYDALAVTQAATAKEGGL